MCPQVKKYGATDYCEICSYIRSKKKLTIMQKLQFILIFILVTISFSCKDDDQAQRVNTEIVVNTTSSPNSFIILSNQDGEVLFSKVGLNGSEFIDLGINPEEEVDFTYGLLLGSQSKSFFIETYRNISIDFEYDITYSCREYVGTNVDQRILTIEDFAGEIIYSPFQDTLRTGSEMVFSGITISKDIAITILDKENSQVKSKLIKLEDWEPQVDGTFTLNLSLDDFKQANEKNITTNVLSDWHSIARVEQADGSQVQLSTLYGYRQEGFITIFLPEGLEYEYVDLQVQSTNLADGYFYVKKKIASFPERIKFVENDFTIIQSDGSGFDIESRSDYNHARIRYWYAANNFLSRWSIYQKDGTDLTYSLPTLPELVLNELSLGEVVSSPITIEPAFIQLNELDETSNYSKNINDAEKCVGYTESYNSSYY